jgi:steroid 5-alpha reductase family enzyme
MYTFLPSLLIVQVIAYLASYPHDGDAPYALNVVAGIAILIQAVVFLHASGLFGNKPTEKYYDATGALTYISLSTYTIMSRGGFGMLSTRQKILAMCVLVWCTRLGYFLYSRICRHNGIDFRFTQIKHNFNRFATFWGVQVKTYLRLL